LATVLSVLFSLDHYIVCPFFSWPLYCLSFFLLAIVLSVLQRITASDYPFGIFKLFLWIRKIGLILFFHCFCFIF
jgi:hypothetical protein